jgi:hypothetical protein
MQATASQVTNWVRVIRDREDSPMGEAVIAEAVQIPIGGIVVAAVAEPVA